MLLILLGSIITFEVEHISENYEYSRNRSNEIEKNRYTVDSVLIDKEEKRKVQYSMYRLVYKLDK